MKKNIEKIIARIDLQLLDMSLEELEDLENYIKYVNINK